MTPICHQYTSEQISLFVDRELSHADMLTIEEHLKQCRQCREQAEQFKTMADIFSKHATRQVDDLEKRPIRESLQAEMASDGKKSQKVKDWLFGKNKILKLASIVAIMIFGWVGYQGQFTAPAGPSAIVQSLDTDYSSVMILETEKQKHTIIWYTET